MGAPPTVTLQYSVANVGAKTLGSLVSRLSLVSLPFSDLAQIGVNIPVISDTTIAVGNSAQRTIIASLLPPVTILAVPSPPTSIGSFVGSMVSSSPQDAPGGTGAQQVLVAYIDTDGIGQQEYVNLNGTSFVTMLAKNQKSTITSITATQFGSSGGAVGFIQVFANPAGQGGLVAQMPVGGTPNQFQPSIVSSSPYDTFTGIGAQQVQISYLDATSTPQSETIALNGTTPVNAIGTNYSVITGMAMAPGAYLSSTGTITLFTGLNGTGGMVAYMGASFLQFFPPQVTITNAVNFQNKVPQNPQLNYLANPYNSPGYNQAVTPPAGVNTIVNADLAAPFRGIYTQIIAAAMESYVTEVDPVIAGL